MLSEKVVLNFMDDSFRFLIQENLLNLAKLAKNKGDLETGERS